MNFITNKLDTLEYQYDCRNKMCNIGGSILKEMEELNFLQRLSSLALGILSALGAILTLGLYKPLRTATKELFAQAWTARIYTSAEIPVNRKNPNLEGQKPNLEECAQIANQIKEGNVITAEQVQAFMQRGGRIQVWKENDIIPLSRNEKYIVGCTSGVNRSQTHRGYLMRNGIAVDAVLAGGDSCFNPQADFPLVSTLTSSNQNDGYHAHFGFDKVDQLGALECGRDQSGDVDNSRKFYEDYVNSLAPTHFITYGRSPSSTLSRLLDRKEESLKGFTITYINWGDEIEHPNDDTIAPFSQEAYARMEQKITEYFPIDD